jgi:membrane associated rhomboid family serine protease
MPRTRLAWPPLTRNIKYTLIGLLVLWVVRIQWTGMVDQYMLLNQKAVFQHGYVWTILTSSLFHLDFFHLLFNGMVLWMVAGQLDRKWSSGWFWGYCLLCALGGGLAVVLSQLALGMNNPTLGYSAVVMGLAAGFAWHNWERSIYVFFVRMPGKYLLLVLVGIDLLRVFGAGKHISISGHLGGMLTGLLLVSGYWRPTRLKRAYKRWQQKRKFDSPTTGKRR